MFLQLHWSPNATLTWDVVWPQWTPTPGILQTIFTYVCIFSKLLFVQFVYKFLWSQFYKVPHGHILDKEVATVTKNRGVCDATTHTEFDFKSMVKHACCVLWICFYPVVHPSSYGEGGVAPLPGCPIYSDAARYTCLSQKGYGLKSLTRTLFELISTILMSMVKHDCCVLLPWGLDNPSHLPSCCTMHQPKGKQ